MALSFLALGALLLLPGLLVVRAPWTLVPALSLAFWALSIWWPPFAGLARGRVLAAALAVWFLLALLRVLPKHEIPPPPGSSPLPVPAPRAVRLEPAALEPGRSTPRLASGPTLVVLAAALALLATASLGRHAPGPNMAFQTTMARLVLWRDGVPLSAEPLLPLAPFGAQAPALATIAADLAALSSVDPARAVLLVWAGAMGLLLLALFTLEATWLRPANAALGSLLGLAVAQGLDWLAPWGSGAAALCLGFALPAVALVLGRASRASAFAAALLLAAALVAQPLLALTVWVLCGAAFLSRRRLQRRGRLLLVSLSAALLAAPGLWPALQALSLAELRLLLSPSGREATAFVLGCLVLALAAFVARRLTRPAGADGRALLAAPTCGLALLALVHVQIQSAQLPRDSVSALERMADSTSPLDVVCAPAPLADWVPALAGRAAGEPGPWIPAVYRDEWAARDRRACQATLVP